MCNGKGASRTPQLAPHQIQNQEEKQTSKQKKNKQTGGHSINYLTNILQKSPRSKKRQGKTKAP